MDQVCPYCKKLIADEEKTCPHCEKRLKPEDMFTHKKNDPALYGLGIILLLVALIYWRGIIKLTGVMEGLFAVVWIIGFAIYVIHLHKGTRGIPWLH
jgi:hypothetical protein